ncbi:MAG: hypothetical protein AAF567_20420 [Actinomycetota bacterium]
MTIRLDDWTQGPTGSGQGGWTAQRFSAAIGQPVTIALRRPIPLETDLQIAAIGDEWHLIEPGVDAPVMIATAWTPDIPDADPVSIEDAASARTGFPFFEDHALPHCFSCGLGASMHVHPGPLSDGRWATDWVAPTWATGPDGAGDPGVLWAAVDCTQGFYAGGLPRRHALTAQLAVEQLAPIEPGGRYAVLGWWGDYPAGWDGRKRGACGAVFDSQGQCVARSRTFWIALDA